MNTITTQLLQIQSLELTVRENTTIMSRIRDYKILEAKTSGEMWKIITMMEDRQTL